MTKIKQSERDRAARLSRSSAGAMLESDIQKESSSKTFEPGEGHSAEESFAVFTPAQKAQVRDMIAAADSASEIEAIERLVQRGVFPAKVGGNIVPANTEKRKRNGEESSSRSKKPRKAVAS